MPGRGVADKEESEERKRAKRTRQGVGPINSESENSVNGPAEAEALPGTLNLAFVEGLYAEYLRDPNATPKEWRPYFEKLRDGDPFARKPALGPSFHSASLFNPPTATPIDGTSIANLREYASLQDRVDECVMAYRTWGHHCAAIDPLERPRPHPPELNPRHYGFTEAELERTVSSHTIFGPEVLTLRQILTRLRNTYCRSIGVQFMHIDHHEVKRWLQERMEATENRTDLTPEDQRRILTRLTDAVIFEDFIQKKYIGAKSFSLEGAESLIPLLDLAIEKAGEQEIQEIVLAMAHRGRLNVLANIMGKDPRKIFREFEDPDPVLHLGRGDVKYHLGYSNDWRTASGRNVHLSLCFNPSHLEFVNPVALGRVRAKQDRSRDYERRAMAIMIHGDAAFIGEGIVQETLNLSQLDPYSTGGTLHVVVNNQIGFTTSPTEARSSLYATAVAKMLQIPVFHVNGEDPEAVAQTVRLSMEFRLRFRRDVVIDMYCYRRRGHNEGDEPSFTQPVMYRQIDKRKPVRENYLEHLLQLDGITREQAEEIINRRREQLERELSVARSDAPLKENVEPGGLWAGYHGGPESKAKEVDTGVAVEKQIELLEKLCELPPEFHLHPKLKRIVDLRREMARGERTLDWAAAEALAFGSLAVAGTRIRMSGQDAERGTFSQRHAVLHDVENGRTHMPLAHLAADQAPVEIYNSPLSETGVLGYEYGYSLDCPDGLVIWEAQFGDFVNVAQVIVDQFIASAEDKWRRFSGVTLLLPHGFEGLGPEHSSARLERFLTLCAEDNLQVAQPTTPAQYFHLLRRQVLRKWRKPLVVMTPKSLLRHPKVVSSMEELANGGFKRILPDTLATEREVTRVLLCSGKIYYELEAERATLGRDDVAILRLEQLYPLSDETLGAALADYRDGTPVVWVQEEPENMGAWRTLRARFCERMLGRFPFSGVSRPASASPATGSMRSHLFEQRQIVEKAFVETA